MPHYDGALAKQGIYPNTREEILESLQDADQAVYLLRAGHMCDKFKSIDRRLRHQVYPAASDFAIFDFKLPDGEAPDLQDWEFKVLDAHRFNEDMECTVRSIGFSKFFAFSFF